MDSEPCTSIANNRFHVFLSFRGPDVRNTFVDHLYTALSEAGLTVFLDSEELEKGKGIDSSLQSAIETSDILIPIFSKRYAESTWCLEEAARMCRSNGFIIPLFYDVQPCDVRYPERNGGAFAQAFQKHRSHLERQDENTIEEWNRALQQISGFSGWSLQESGQEWRLVRTVVNGVLDILKKRVPLDVPTHLVGLDWGIREVIRSLHLNSTDRSLVRVGINGIGGIGKTTLAKAVYNEIHRRFDASCFLFNIGATAPQNKTTLAELQGRILRRLVNYGGEVPSVDEGRYLMRDRLRGIRALVVLDDVNERDQLLSLYGNGDWFGHGSRVIITSRDQHMLNLAKVDSVFKMTGLGKDDALKLFCWNAFYRALPETPYEELSAKLASACRGHPLVLQVIGSYLSDKKEPNDIRCWEETVHNIGENPEVLKVLRTSYNGLSHVEQEIFLDIACCFVGERKSDADLFWEVLYPNKVQTAIKNLSLKMLIEVSDRESDLYMHDLLREMGRGIQEQAGNNSRFFLPMGAHKDLNRDEAEKMKMLVYTGQNENEPVVMDNMPSLRYLLLQNTKVAVGTGKLTPNLIWMKIRNSEIVSERHGWTWTTSRKEHQLDGSWSQMRILSLDSCAFPTKIPNTLLHSLVNLQCLYIQRCNSLTTLPSTVGNLSQLKQLRLCGCTSLTSLPDTLGNLAQLEELCLGLCSGLNSLPHTIGDLAKLRWLMLNGCSGLRILPDTIGNLAELKDLTLQDCSGLQTLPYAVGKLKNLKYLNFNGCPGLGSFHDTVVKLAQLREGNRSTGLRSLAQKEFNVYLEYCAADTEEVAETLMGHLQKCVRIRRREEEPGLCTESLRICKRSVDNPSRDIRGVIERSDILISVRSDGYLGSSVISAARFDYFDRHHKAMRDSTGLIVPFLSPDFRVHENVTRLPVFHSTSCCGRWLSSSPLRLDFN